MKTDKIYKIFLEHDELVNEIRFKRETLADSLKGLKEHPIKHYLNGNYKRVKQIINEVEEGLKEKQERVNYLTRLIYTREN